MPTWYGNVCRTGRAARRSQPSTADESEREMGRRRDERGREPMAADASALPHLSTSLSRGRRL